MTSTATADGLPPREAPDPQLKLPGMPPGLYHPDIADHVVRGGLPCGCANLPRTCACPCDCGSQACCEVTGLCCWCLWADEMQFM